LNDVFAQVGFHRFNTGSLKGRVETDFFGEHRLAFDRQGNLMPAGDLDAMGDGGFPVRGKMDVPPVLLYFFNKCLQEDVEVGNGFHPHIMTLEPESRAFRKATIAFGRATAETLLQVGQGHLQDRIIDRRVCFDLVSRGSQSAALFIDARFATGIRSRVHRRRTQTGEPLNAPRSTGEQLRQMDRFQRRPDAAQPPLDVHQAADITAGDGTGPGGNYVPYFFVDHGNGNVRVFDGEGASKAAAHVGLVHFNQFCALDVPYQASRLFGDPQPP
jgi:hypothetical protein